MPASIAAVFQLQLMALAIDSIDGRGLQKFYSVIEKYMCNYKS